MPRASAIVWEMPEELNEAGTTAMVETAVDAALLNHRRDALPRHFTREAIGRYGAAYEGACPGPSPRNAIAKAAALERGALSAALKGMSTESRRDYFANWRREQRERMLESTRATRGLVSSGSRDRTKDRRNEIPLYDTGAYKAFVLQGAGTLAGPTFSRTMKIEVPLPYANVVRKNWKGVGLKKTPAVQATTTDEVEAFAATMNTRLQEQFNAVP